VLGVIGDASDLRRAAKLVAHPDERIAAAATNAVSELASRHVSAARTLLRESRPPQDPVVLGCILLGAIASTQPLLDDDVHLLERALEHDDPQVRRAALEALAQTGSSAAADAVVFALSDEEREVQFAAVRALGRLRHAEPLVGIITDTRDPELTAMGLRALGEADPSKAMQVAAPLVRHSDPAIACAAVEAVGQLGEDAEGGTHAADREDLLFAALDHSDAEVVKLALSLVGLNPGARALVRLGLCLDHPSGDVRCIAAELLALDKSAAAQKLLRVRYEREKDPTVREAIAQAVSIRSPADVAERVDAATAQGAKVG
jgi:HEAT repeat protein